MLLRIFGSKRRAGFKKESVMRLFVPFAIMIVAGLVASHRALAEVRVTFINSYYYGYFRDKSEDKRSATLDDLRKTFETLGASYLASTEVLKIDVLDFSPLALSGSAGGPVPAEMQLQYVLRRDGKIIARDNEFISDINYVNMTQESEKKDPLAPEKEMLHDWFSSRFGNVTTPSE